MEKEDPEYESWSGFIYRHNDDELLYSDAAKKGFDVVPLTPEDDQAAVEGDEEQSAELGAAASEQCAEDATQSDADATEPSTTGPKPDAPKCREPDFSDEDIYEAVQGCRFDYDDKGEKHRVEEIEVRLKLIRTLHAALTAPKRGLLRTRAWGVMNRHPQTGRLMTLGGAEFANCITNWGIPPGDLRNAVAKGLEHMVQAESEIVDIHALWHYSKDQRLYVNIENRELLEINSGGHRLLPNGTHGGVDVRCGRRPAQRLPRPHQRGLAREGRVRHDRKLAA